MEEEAGDRSFFFNYFNRYRLVTTTQNDAIYVSIVRKVCIFI